MKAISILMNCTSNFNLDFETKPFFNPVRSNALRLSRQDTPIYLRMCPSILVSARCSMLLVILLIGSRVGVPGALVWHLYSINVVRAGLECVCHHYRSFPTYRHMSSPSICVQYNSPRGHWHKLPGSDIVSGACKCSDIYEIGRSSDTRSLGQWSTFWQYIRQRARYQVEGWGFQHVWWGAIHLTFGLSAAWSI